MSPNDFLTMKDIAWHLSTNPDASIRNGKEALTLAQRASVLAKGSDPMTLIALSAAYAETDHFEEAIDTANDAKKLRLSRTTRPWWIWPRS